MNWNNKPSNFGWFNRKLCFHGIIEKFEKEETGLTFLWIQTMKNSIIHPRLRRMNSCSLLLWIHFISMSIWIVLSSLSPALTTKRIITKKFAYSKLKKYLIWFSRNLHCVLNLTMSSLAVRDVEKSLSTR